MRIELTVNGAARSDEVEPRLLPTAAVVLVLAGLGLWSSAAMRAVPMGGLAHRGGPPGQVARAARGPAAAPAGHDVPHAIAVAGTSRNVPVSY
jgi:hypothetical protein